VWDMLNRPHSWYLKYYKLFNDDINVPIYAVMWNHDVMWNNTLIQEVSKISSIKLLGNWVLEDKWIRIVSIKDKSIWRNQPLENIMKETWIDNDDSKFTIFMTHQPIRLEKLENYPIDLEIAGHTHRGQILWFRQLVYFMNDYWYWRYDHNWKIAFVSQWIWTWWLPFRFWTQSEMVEINLKKK
jgi:predicted MPP superfamily phosphohydrolase